jgi:serine/threonine protein kinase
MGEIYRGHAIETGDPVAIKVMRTDLVDNATALALFRKEALALNNIQHNAIVRYYIFSYDPGTGRHYLAMEFVDGQPLSELLQRGPLGFEAVCLLKERLAAGLNAAHQLGIVHRDLSPDNVLIPADDLAKAKIIDFGIARSTRGGDGTIIGSGFAGKYNYVSPEQLGLFREVTAKSDIYSLGLVLAQCLRGRPIDMGGTQWEVLEKRRVVPDLRAVDPRFRPLLEKMLQPNPADRPESMAAVAAWRLEPQDQAKQIPTIPPQRPAALEPVWQEGRLTLPKKPAKTGLSKKKFADALSALRNELRDFSEAIASEGNIDRRFVSFVQSLAARIPDKPPSNEELFQFGHLQERFAGYAKTVDQEWPAFLATCFHALTLQYDQTMRQSPVWREFKQNAAPQTLNTEQVASAHSLAAGAASALRDQEFVDPALPASLEQLANSLNVPELADGRPAQDVIEAGKELLAADLVESVNNILKRIAEAALPAVGKVAATMRDRAGSVLSKTGGGWADGFEKGAAQEAKKIGRVDGARAVRWLHRLAMGVVTGGGILGGGVLAYDAFTGLSNLIAKYPEVFTWLTRLLPYFQ